MIQKITFHNSHYKYRKKIQKKFVSSKKNLTFALEMFETAVNYPQLKVVGLSKTTPIV